VSRKPPGHGQVGQKSMRKDSVFQVTKSYEDPVVGTLTDGVRHLLAEEGVEAREFLRASFLTSAVDTLWHARREAGLTQSQVAEALGTRQSAVARMEADTSGSMSLHRYVDYCMACGVLPFDFELESIDRLREFAQASPELPRTARNVNL